MKKKIKVRWINIVMIIIFVISLCGLIYSGFKIVKWFVASNKINNQVEEINKTIEIVEVKEEDEKVEIVNPPKEEDKSNPYWDYIKMNLINVDFKELKQTNSDVKGWIQVNGTNINYPFVQAKDNYYLKRALDKTYNEAGWVFLDYRNNIDLLDKNNILYGHGRLDNTMFGSLKNILKSNWYKNPDNYIIKLSTEKANTMWQVFSVYHIPTTSDYLQTEFNSDEEYMKFLKMLYKRSEYDFKINFSKEDKILSLSTCYNNDKERVVMHAKLIKIQNR